MDKDNSDIKKDKRPMIYLIVLLTIVFILVVVVIYILSQKKEVLDSDGRKITNSDMVICSTNVAEDAFFVSDVAVKRTHEIRMTLMDDKIKKISYTFYGEYDSNEDVVEDENKLHSDYNIYMGENGVDINILNPTYSTEGNTLKIGLFLDEFSRIDSVIDDFFLIDDEDLNLIGNNKADELTDYYKKQGLFCVKK